MGIKNNQSDISGELLSSSFIDGSNSSLSVTRSYQDLSSLSISFTSDRTGSCEIYCQVCVEKVSSGTVEAFYLALFNSLDSLVDEKIAKVFHSSDGIDTVTFSFILSVSSGSSYSLKLKCKASSDSIFVARWGADYAPLIMKAVGL